jgi:DNA-binding MarR family transcriptional regulator
MAKDAVPDQSGTPAHLSEALAQLAARLQGALERSAAAAGLSAGQARMLRALDGGAPTINELAGRLGLDKSSTSGLVDRAEARGLVRRVPSQRDRRSVRVRASAPGRELGADASALLAGELATMLGPLSAAERATLATIAARLLDG